MKHPVVLATLSAFLVGAMVATAMVQRWGADVALVLSDPVGSTLIAGFGGAIVGSVVGGIVTYVLGRISARQARGAKYAADGRRLMIKASLILTDIVAIQRTIDESLDNANQKGIAPTDPLWRRVPGVIGAFQHYEVDSDELAVLIAGRAFGLVNDAITLIMKYETLTLLVTTYNEKRSQMKTLLPSPIAQNGHVLETPVTPDDQARLQPYVLELETLMAQIRRALPVLRETAERVAFGVGPIVRALPEVDDFPVLGPNNRLDAVATR